MGKTDDIPRIRISDVSSYAIIKAAVLWWLVWFPPTAFILYLIFGNY